MTRGILFPRQYEKLIQPFLRGIEALLVVLDPDTLLRLPESPVKNQPDRL